MASLDQHKSGTFRIRFRYGGRQFFRSLDTDDPATAQALKGQVEETLRLLKRGVLSLPNNATTEQVGSFIVTGGKRNGKDDLRGGRTLGEAIDQYLLKGTRNKAGSTVAGERTHAGHIKRVLNPDTPLSDITVDKLDHYAERRLLTVEAETVRKELQTLNQVWAFAKGRGWVSGDLPKKGIALPNPNELPPFQTWEEIEAAAARGEPDANWDNLFLREQEIDDLLEHVRQHARHSFVYPMVAVCAMTGVRRSELIRAQVSDVDLDANVVKIRERKRRRTKSGSFRRVDMCPRLATILRDWLHRHPGGTYLFCVPGNLTRRKSKSPEPQPLTKDMATDHLKRVLANSKWAVVRGYHTLRHSFISICAMRGVPQAIIDKWAGHQTPEMARRYRHLFPEEIQAAVARLFNGD
ncbi:MAG: tyrosine-type recombinase/integrase [Planctomycetota bacterium]|jgi:integrase